MLQRARFAPGCSSSMVEEEEEEEEGTGDGTLWSEVEVLSVVVAVLGLDGNSMVWEVAWLLRAAACWFVEDMVPSFGCLLAFLKMRCSS